MCRLDYALYGHPKAGDIWGDRLEQVLVDERNFTAVEGWPSVYLKRFPRRNGDKPGVMLVIAYVDDLLFLLSRAGVIDAFSSHSRCHQAHVETYSFLPGFVST